MNFKSYLLAWSIGFICHTVHAQFSINVQGGANVATISLNGEGELNSQGDVDFITQYFMGISPQYMWADRWQILADIQFSVKGYAFDSDFAGILNDHYKDRMMYVEFAPQIVYLLSPTFGVSGGVYVAYQDLSARKSDDSGWQTHYFELYNQFDAGAVVGVRGQLNRFYVFINYQHGLSDVFDHDLTDNNGNVYTDIKVMNRNIQLGAGFRLWKSKKEN